LVETLTSLQVELTEKGVEQVTEAIRLVTKETEKAKKSSKEWGLAHLAAIAGVIKSSPIAMSYMAELSAMTGAFADIILTQWMPIIEPIIAFGWELTEIMENMGPTGKIVVAAMVGIGVAMWMLTAHPLMLAIIVLIGGFVLLRRETGSTKAALMAMLNPFTSIVLIVKALSHLLTGGSLVPDLAALGNVIKTIAMPQLMLLKLGVEGVAMVVGTAGAAVQKTFTMINNFTFGGITNTLEGVTEGIDAVGGAAKKVSGWMGF